MDCPGSSFAASSTNAGFSMDSADATPAHMVATNQIARAGAAVLIGRLTVKLSGRPAVPDRRRGRILSSSARSAQPPTPHGPLQRLLDAIVCHSDAFGQFFKSGGWFP